MITSCRRANARAVRAWRKHPVYKAKVVFSAPAAIVVMSRHLLAVGQRISFVPLADLEKVGSETPTADSWHSAVIWRIDDECLHLTRT